MNAKTHAYAVLIAALALLDLGCRATGPHDAPQPNPADGVARYFVKVNWTPNREKAVNTTGGGYRVYYSLTPDFGVATAAFVDVPYVSGPTAPTTVTLASLGAGNYYVRIAAYSQLNSSGSAASAEISARGITTSLLQSEVRR